MTCFQIPLQSYSIFISSCLGRILTCKLHSIPSVHEGSTIIPMIFNYNLKFTHSERMVDSIMLLLVFHLCIPISLILHGGLNVNSPTLVENHMRLCVCFFLSFFPPFFTAARIQTRNCSPSPGTPCIFFCSLGRWLRGVQSTPPRLPPALFGC